MKDAPTRWQPLLERHGVGLLFAALVALGVVAPGTGPSPSLVQVGWMLGGPMYVAYLTLGVGTLLLASIRERDLRGLLRRAGVLLTTIAVAYASKLWLGSWFPRPSGTPDGFPSLLSAVVFSLAFLLTEWKPGYAVFWYLMAALLAWSRLAAGSQFAPPIIGGMLLGLLVGLCFHLPQPQNRTSAPVSP